MKTLDDMTEPELAKVTTDLCFFCRDAVSGNAYRLMNPPKVAKTEVKI